MYRWRAITNYCLVAQLSYISILEYRTEANSRSSPKIPLWVLLMDSFFTLLPTLQVSNTDWLNKCYGLPLRWLKETLNVYPFLSCFGTVLMPPHDINHLFLLWNIPPIKAKVHSNGKMLSIIVKWIWLLFNLALFQGVLKHETEWQILQAKKYTSCKFSFTAQADVSPGS